MTEVGDTAGPDHVAARLVKDARLSLLMSIFMSGLAVADLLTGALIDSWRVDIALLAGSAMTGEGVYSRRRLAARIRRGDMRGPVTLRVWIRSTLSVAMSFLFVGAIGYLLGGLIVAIALPGAALATCAVALGIGIRRRRRRRVALN